MHMTLALLIEHSRRKELCLLAYFSKLTTALLASTFFPLTFFLGGMLLKEGPTSDWVL